MSAVLLRRRKLGKKSTEGIANVSTTGIKVVRNWMDEFPEDLSLVFRWGCTSNTPGGSRQKVVNTAAAIHWCSNKKQGRLDMQAAGVPVPKTWGDPGLFERDEPWPLVGQNGKQYVVRPAQHAQGRNLFVGNGQDSVTAWHRFGGGYISQLINKVAEYRVMVVQNRVVWVAQKTPGNPEDVAWNVAQGGRFDNVRWGNWPKRVVTAALAAAKVGKLDFAGVDVMVDAEGNPYVLEVNSAPSQTSPYRQQCLAKAFDYIVTNGKEHFPDPTGRRWSDVIHPAVRGES